jgi:hypothetical protein
MRAAYNIAQGATSILVHMGRYLSLTRLNVRSGAAA